MTATKQRIEDEFASQHELGKALKKYAGKWVAVSGPLVVASADTPEAVLEQIVAEEIDGILRIPKEKGAAFL